MSDNLFDLSEENNRARLLALGWVCSATPSGPVWHPPAGRGGHGVGLREEEALAWLGREEAEGKRDG